MKRLFYIFVAARSGNDFCRMWRRDDSSEIDIPEVPNDPGNDDDKRQFGNGYPETERF